jgi:hypothetical protein
MSRYFIICGTYPENPRATFFLSGPQAEEHVPPEVAALLKSDLTISRVVLYRDKSEQQVVPEITIYQRMD